MEAPPKRVERLEDHKDGKASPLREGEKKLLRFLCHNFLSAYSDNITNSFVCVCVCVCTGAKAREGGSAREAERERHRERETEQGRGRLHILSPNPPITVKPQEGGARP